MKFAPEGWPFILGAATLTIVVFALGGRYVTILPLILTLFMFYFFRDPDRTIPTDPDVFVAPADGTIIVINDVFEPEFLKKNTKKISIFMSPFNVHVNRSPSDGTVKQVVHRKGKFKAAYSDDAAQINENTSMVLDTAHGPVLVRQIAGLIARRIVCRVKEGVELEQGERYGMIKFSSRVDIFLPEIVSVEVSMDDSVKAGETVLARISR